MDALKVEKADLVTHDIGNMVGYALAAQFPARITKWVVIDAPLPGIGAIWDAQLVNPKTWHFNFFGPDEERLVAGRERIFLDRFYNELSAHPERIDVATRAHYAALYGRPHAMHDAFEQFKAFHQDGIDNRDLLAKGGKLTMPVLALGGGAILRPHHEADLDHVAANVNRRRRSRQRPLDHGREPGRDGEAGGGFPRRAADAVAGEGAVSRTTQAYRDTPQEFCRAQRSLPLRSSLGLLPCT